jgi:hypothetical protein
MAVQKGHQAQGAVQDAKRMANSAQENIWVDRLTRIGYFSRGVIYGLIGYLAARLVFTGRGQITDQQGALAAIASHPFGKFLLIVIAVGLVGLFIWGLVRAVADPYHKGSDTKGLISRAGYLVSGISYAVLLVPTLNLIQGTGRSSGGSSQSAQNAAAGILSHSWGPLVVALIGLILIGVGIFRIYAGYKNRLNEKLKAYAMSAEQRRWAIRLGRLGYIALGIVFITLGFLALLAARTSNPSQLGGVDKALTFLARQSYGPYILAVVAVGLIAYAIYSILGAFWFRIKEL